MTSHDERIEAEGVGEGLDEVPVVGDVGGAGAFGVAVAGKVHGDGGVPRGEGLELGGPNLVVAPGTVHEQDYLALLLAC